MADHGPIGALDLSLPPRLLPGRLDLLLGLHLGETADGRLMFLIQRLVQQLGGNTRKRSEANPLRVKVMVRETVDVSAQHLSGNLPELDHRKTRADDRTVHHWRQLE